MQMKYPICPRCNGTGKIYDNKKIGRSLKQMRVAAGVSSQKVADIMGYSQTYIVLLEAGRRNWTERLVRKFTYALRANSTNSNATQPNRTGGDGSSPNKSNR
jgi:Predicted transcriptional regulator with C-terminal CBS domains